MLSADMAAVLHIQSECYTMVAPESEASLTAKHHAAPSACFVACEGERVLGYLISMPWRFDSPPDLNASSCIIPNGPDCLYLHDLAVAPMVRKTGAGRALVNTFLSCLAELALPRANLIAVQSSAPYWRRYNFQSVPLTPSLKLKLANYGDGVEYMEYRIEKSDGS
ncbi:MAG: GNAT family N-acetyltransferase [Proteobacteria bacterium]|nr:GNAT family N-acetyltransferase [Pseudomonadota bacterium]